MTKRSSFFRYPALWTAAAGLAAVASVHACSSPTEVKAVRVDRVTLTPTSLNLVVGSEQQLAASCVDAAGIPITGMAVSYVSQDAGVASVNVSGMVRAVAPGNTQVTAGCDLQGTPRQASASVTVSLVPATVVSVEPAAFTIGVNQIQQLTATPKDAAGNPLLGRTVSWRSSNTAVATVSASGLVTATGGGTATLTATVGSTSGAALVTVPLPVYAVELSPSNTTMFLGSVVQFTATPKDSTGAPLLGRVVSWSSTNLAVAGVSTTGLVTALGGGGATITATCEGKSAASQVTVPTPVASVILSQTTATLAELRTVQPVVTLRDATNTVLLGRVVTWTSSDPSVADVTSLGLVTARRAGSAVITAASEGRSATLAVTVILAPVATITVSPSSATVPRNQAQQLTATVRDSSGNALPGRTVVWTSSASAVAIVSATGLVSAVSPGAATITATSGGVSATASITVPVPVASVTVSPSTLSLSAGQSQQFTATPRDAAGTALSGRVVVWTSSASTVASVSSTGFVTAMTGGTATITATVEGVSATSAVTVPVAVASVTMSVATQRMTPGQQTTLVATTKDNAGFTLVGRTIAWSTSNPAVAAVTQAGLVTGVALGAATITATSEGKSATTAVSVIGWSLVRTGRASNCGIVTDGTPYCWGYNYSGQLGDGSTTSRNGPTAVGGGFRFDMITVGGSTTCALESTGRAYCWGEGANGQLGNGASASRGLPQPVAGGFLFLSIAPGTGGHTCGVSTANDAYCWGRNYTGQMGNGTTSSYYDGANAPVAVSGGLKFSTVVVGDDHSCGLVSGLVYCWGDNYYGQLGDGTNTDRFVPTPVRAPGLSFRALYASGNQACALSTGNYVYCWGANNSGSFGDGTSNSATAPVLAAGGLQFTSISLSVDHACGVDQSGRGYCWGRGGSGELGDGSSNSRYSPTQVTGGHTWSMLGAGSYHSCGLTTAGALLCWGSNSDGAIGDGTSTSRSVPTVVRMP